MKMLYKVDFDVTSKDGSAVGHYSRTFDNEEAQCEFWAMLHKMTQVTYICKTTRPIIED